MAWVDPGPVKTTWRQKNSLFAAGIEQELFGTPTCSLVPITTTIRYPWIICVV